MKVYLVEHYDDLLEHSFVDAVFESKSMAEECMLNMENKRTKREKKYITYMITESELVLDRNGAFKHYWDDLEYRARQQ